MRQGTSGQLSGEASSYHFCSVLQSCSLFCCEEHQRLYTLRLAVDFKHPAGHAVDFKHPAGHAVDFKHPAVHAVTGVHEAGHQWAAKRRGLKLSLPFFIPAGLGLLGSFGSITRIKGTVPDRYAGVMSLSSHHYVCITVTVIIDCICLIFPTWSWVSVHS